MRFIIIAILVLIPLIMMLSLASPLLAGRIERSIGPAAERPAAAAASGDPARGEVLYRSNCYGCHAPEAKVGPAVADIKVQLTDDETIAAVVRSGSGLMPAFHEATLNDQDLADIIAYIRTLK